MGEEGPPKTEMINPALLDGVSANFIVKGPNGVEKAYPMRSITVTIGRSDACEISVKDSSMSGKHAEISKINGEIRVKDLGSANGIWLNGERVEDVELYDGDVLRCGQTSIRVDVVGGRKRPDAGMSPKILALIIVGVLDLVEQRSQVTNTFIADWKKLGQATNGYATALDQAFLQGNKAVCPAVDKGVQAKTAGEVLVSCNKNFDKAKNAVEEKLKELDEVAGGGSGEAASE